MNIPGPDAETSDQRPGARLQSRDPMSVRHDSILAARLAAEIASRGAGRAIHSLRLAPREGEAALRFENGSELRIALAEGLVRWRPGRRGVDSGRGGNGAGREPLPLAGRLLSCAAPADERTLLLSFGEGGEAGVRTLAVELRPRSGNVLLVDRDGRIEAALHPCLGGGRDAATGAEYRPPLSPRRWSKEFPGEEEWTELFGPLPPAGRRAAALREVAWLSPLNAGAVLGSATEQAGEDALRAAWERYAALRACVTGARSRGDGKDEGEREAEGSGTPAWLLSRPWGPQPYPCSLWEADAEPAPSLLEGMERVAAAALIGQADTAEGVTGPGTEAVDGAPEPEETAALRRALERRLRRTERRRAALARELARSDPEPLRQLGHLLLARHSEVRRGDRTVTLTGFDGEPVEVELDPALGPVENAERLYSEARRRERAVRRLPAEIRRTEAAGRRLREALARLEASGPDPQLWRLAGGRPSAERRRRGAPAEAPPLPYRRLRSSGGLEIRVGRGARANDELTFHHSAPEDIWLHARQARGAHVILRWGKKGENPPRRDLAEAAVVAAVHSEARHSGTVPVDWTRRKYVRKPRGSPPGAVVPERVQTLFVTPDTGLVERLGAGES